MLKSNQKIRKTLLFLIILLIISSCTVEKFFLEKPEDTNLEAWITEPISAAVNKMTFVPGMFGGDMYLGSKYKLVETDSKDYVLPDEYVLYTYSGYPDLMDRYHLVKIEIRDPEVFVYNLTMLSEQNIIEETMKSNEFKKHDDNTYSKNHCAFYFNSDGITIVATQSNKNNIIY